MEMVVAALAALVSALTITQGVRTLTAGARLRDRTLKDIAIRDGLPEGPVRDELEASIKYATIRLIATEAIKPKWWILPFIVVSVTTGAVHFTIGWQSETGMDRLTAMESFMVAVSGVGLLYVEAERLEHGRRPLRKRLRAERPDPNDSPSAIDPPA